MPWVTSLWAFLPKRYRPVHLLLYFNANGPDRLLVKMLINRLFRVCAARTGISSGCNEYAKMSFMFCMDSSVTFLYLLYFGLIDLFAYSWNLSIIYHTIYQLLSPAILSFPFTGIFQLTLKCLRALYETKHAMRLPLPHTEQVTKHGLDHNEKSCSVTWRILKKYRPGLKAFAKWSPLESIIIKLFPVLLVMGPYSRRCAKWVFRAYNIVLYIGRFML